MSLVPEAGRINGHLGDCRMLQEGDYAKAIESFNREPIDFMRLTGLAIAYNKLGQQETAQQCLDELTALEGETASYQ